MDDSFLACCTECGTEPEKTFWLNKDCCGLFCGMVTDILLAFAEFVMLTVVIIPWMGDSVWGMVHGVAFTSIVLLGVISHFKAMTTDPGAVPKNAVPADFEPGDQGKSFRVCLKCDTYKPQRTHHCSICQRCIVKMDHHCPWVNNCVGLGNHKFFLLFLFYVFTASVYALSLVFARFVHCSGHSPSRRRQRLRGKSASTASSAMPGGIPVVESVVETAVESAVTNLAVYAECDLSIGSNILIFVLVIEAILFGLFTMCMMCDQWSVVLTSATKIDRLKGAEKGSSKRSICDNLNEVFGGEPRFSLHWLLPTDVKFSRPEQMYGYRVHDETELAAMKSIVIPDLPEDGPLHGDGDGEAGELGDRAEGFGAASS